MGVVVCPAGKTVGCVEGGGVGATDQTVVGSIKGGGVGARKTPQFNNLYSCYIHIYIKIYMETLYLYKPIYISIYNNIYQYILV